MFLILPLLALAAADSTILQTPNLKKNGKIQQSGTINKAGNLRVRPQIVGGENVSSITQLPWQVHVDNGGTCGGAVIDDDWVLTAAHCVVNKAGVKATKVNIMFGATIYNGHQNQKMFMTVGGDNIIVHENYNTVNLDNDIAVIKLHVPLPLSKTKNKYIMSIKLPSSTDGKQYENERVILSGWGKTNDTEQTSNTLKWINTTVMTNDACNEALTSFGMANAKPQHICAKAEIGGLSSCSGDSGGPMTLLKNKKYTLLGLTSYGDKCSDGSPGVYVRLTYYIDWIEKKTGLNL